MKPFLIVLCYHGVLGIAFLERGGGWGSYFAAWCLLRDSFHAQHFERSNVKSSGSKPSWKRVSKPDTVKMSV